MHEHSVRQIRRKDEEEEKYSSRHTSVSEPHSRTKCGSFGFAKRVSVKSGYFIESGRLRQKHVL